MALSDMTEQLCLPCASLTEPAYTFPFEHASTSQCVLLSSFLWGLHVLNYDQLTRGRKRGKTSYF